MLQDFIIANRDVIIDRVRTRVREGTVPEAIGAKLERGVPLFLTQLADALPSAGALQPAEPDGGTQAIADSAAEHGHALLRKGFTVAQVVHGYGDVCQVVTELAVETGAAISSDDFRVFNRCLDDAIAGAVTAYASQREHDLEYEGAERLGVLMHEVRNLLNTAMLSFEVIRKGLVGLGGSTGAIHSRSLGKLRVLVERSFAEVRLGAGMPRFENFSLLEFIEEVEATSAMLAEGHGVQLQIGPVATDATIVADRQLLASAISNLLQNAFKFTRPNGTVSLITRTTPDRIYIDVCDECGGLPPGQAEGLFTPFSQRGDDRSGLGLGLSIALSAARANLGELHVRDIPGHGCVFTVELRQKSPAASLSQAPPEGDRASESPGSLGKGVELSAPRGTR